MLGKDGAHKDTIFRAVINVARGRRLIHAVSQGQDLWQASRSTGFQLITANQNEPRGNGYVRNESLCGAFQ